MLYCPHLERFFAVSNLCRDRWSIITEWPLEDEEEDDDDDEKEEAEEEKE